jgi:hypothetical protein
VLVGLSLPQLSAHFVRAASVAISKSCALPGSIATLAKTAFAPGDALPDCVTDELAAASVVAKWRSETDIASAKAGALRTFDEMHSRYRVRVVNMICFACGCDCATVSDCCLVLVWDRVKHPCGHIASFSVVVPV